MDPIDLIIEIARIVAKTVIAKLIDWLFNNLRRPK